MRVLFTGSREWRKFRIIRNVVNQLVAKYGVENLVFIHGKAKRGADLAVNNFAVGLAIEQEPYPADWDKYGKAAGPIRNKEMYEQSKPDLVVAFHVGTSGTQNMIDIALSGGTPTAIYDDSGKATKHNWKDI
jgi:hypothetical protein